MWILGPKSVEMDAIERLLKADGRPYRYATYRGRRVTADNRDKADFPQEGEYVLVDCNFEYPPICGAAAACEMKWGDYNGCSDHTIEHLKDGNRCPYTGTGVRYRVIRRDTSAKKPLDASLIGQVFKRINTLGLAVCEPSYRAPGQMTVVGYSPGEMPKDEDDEGIPARVAQTTHQKWVLVGEAYTGFGDEKYYYEVSIPDDVVRISMEG